MLIRDDQLPIIILASTALLAYASCWCEPAFAQMGAMQQAGRLSCEASELKKIKERSDSGIAIVQLEGPLPPPPGTPDNTLVAYCRSYILKTGTYHRACPCPL